MSADDSGTGIDLRAGDRSVAWPRLVLFGLVVAVVLTAGVAAATSTTAFDPYNPWWDGSSGFKGMVDSDPTVESELVRDTTAYEAVDPEGTVAFVVAPEEPYEDEDAERVASFVDDGGTLVVLENFDAAGNDLLADVGADARTDGQLLRDEHNHYRGPAMPIATGVENHSLTTGVDQLTLNYATAVNPGSEDTTVLVRTSDISYLGDSDETLDDQDEFAAYPVATVENVGAGRVIVVGDPSIVTNALLDRPDNAAFVHRVYADEERVLLDISHVTNLPPLTRTAIALRDAPLLQGLLGAIGIAVIAALSDGRASQYRDRAARLFSNRRRSTDLERAAVEAGLSEAEKAEFLRQKRPEWDEERIQHVVQAVKRMQPEETNDE